MYVYSPGINEDTGPNLRRPGFSLGLLETASGLTLSKCHGKGILAPPKIKIKKQKQIKRKRFTENKVEGNKGAWCIKGAYTEEREHSSQICRWVWLMGAGNFWVSLLSRFPSGLVSTIQVQSGSLGSA